MMSILDQNAKVKKVIVREIQYIVNIWRKYIQSLINLRKEQMLLDIIGQNVFALKICIHHYRQFPKILMV